MLRVSGPRAFPVVSAMTGLSPSSIPPRTLFRCAVRDADGKAVDSGMLACFPGPRSFTGEDLAEIYLHGNPLLVERAALAACALGAVPAAPGEFSRRAFENGKMDLTQAEALADLISARTLGAARAALRQLRGELGESIAPLRERLLSLLALLEASIDFSDEEDVPGLSQEQLIENIKEIRCRLRAFRQSYARGRLCRDGADVAIAGVVNVGKSSLLNRLLGEERAIVTEIPGTTRDFLRGEAVLGGIPVRFVDTAGLRAALDPVEREGVRRSREAVAAADLVLFVLDGSRPALPADREAYAAVEGRPHLVVLNKSDLSAAESGGWFSGAGIVGRVAVSARTGGGIAELLEAVGRALLPREDDAGGPGDAPLTRIRHADAVDRADAALGRAEASAAAGLSEEFPALDVREASQALAELTGEIAPEEVLGEIFRSFCIGK
jgi:tRNA modification GTPase